MVAVNLVFIKHWIPDIFGFLKISGMKKVQQKIKKYSF